MVAMKADQWDDCLAGLKAAGLAARWAAQMAALTVVLKAAMKAACSVVKKAEQRVGC